MILWHSTETGKAGLMGTTTTTATTIKACAKQQHREPSASDEIKIFQWTRDIFFSDVMKTCVHEGRHTDRDTHNLAADTWKTPVHMQKHTFCRHANHKNTLLTSKTFRCYCETDFISSTLKYKHFVLLSIFIYTTENFHSNASKKDIL